MRLTDCVCCGAPLEPCAEAWRAVCRSCGYEGSDLVPTINAADAHALIDEDARETGLKETRVHNFRELVDVIARLKPGGGTLLDVGAAHGWFLEQARGQFDVLGIEPDEAVFERAARRGLPMRNGYFPDALDRDERLDLIVFNDVIEHIPDIGRIVDACREHLRAGGLLLLNLPSSNGVFYRLAKLLNRFGFGSYLERLWQKGLPSPHVHYFNPSNLERLLRRHGFRVVVRGQLSTLRYRGLWTRVSYTGEQNLLTRLVLVSVIGLALPLLKLLPSDIVYVLSEPA